MKKLTCLPVIVLGALALTVSASAATYYVSPGGDDKNPGASPDKAWATFKRSCAALRSGDTLNVAEGSYRPNDPFVLDAQPVKDEDVSKPVVIRAERPRTAIIHGDNPLSEFTQAPGYNGVFKCSMPVPPQAIVESDTDIVYERTGNLTDTEETVGAYYYDPGAKLLYVHTTDGAAPDRHALWGSLYSTGAYYRGPASKDAPHRAIILDGLVFKGFSSMALDLRGAQNLTVRNCVFYHNCYGIYLANYARRCRIENNLLLSNNMPRHGSQEQASILVNGNVADIVVDGNVARYNRYNNIRCYGGTIPEGSTVVFSNNRCYGEAPFWFKPSEKGSRMIGNVAEGEAGTDYAASNTFPAYGEYVPKTSKNELLYGSTPESKAAAKFVDTVNGDYRLQSDSPFRGKGPGGSDLGALPYKGDVFFVGPVGNDAAAGTSLATAWKSLAKSVARLKSGHTLYLLEGTYPEPVRITQQATAENPITLRRHGKGQVVLDGMNQSDVGIELEGAAGVCIEGLEIRGFKRSAIQANRARDIRIAECLVHDNSGDGVRMDGCANAILCNNTMLRNSAGLVSREMAGALECVGNILPGDSKPHAGLDEASAKNYYGNYNCYVGPGVGLALDRAGSIQADPLFADAGKGDFRLQAGSPCRGRGEFERTMGRNDLVSVVPDVPKIQDVKVHYIGGTTATITYWTPQNPAYALLEYAAGKEAPQRVDMDMESRIFHVVNLTGLKPGIEYTFRPGVRYAAESWIERTRRVWGQSGGTQADKEIFGAGMTFQTLPADPASRTLHVRSDGDDQRNGLTPATAWRTLRAACRQARAGDTVLVGPGRYFETLSPWNSGAGPKARIIFRSEKPREAVLDGNDFALPYAVKVINKGYVTVDGFRLEYQNANPYSMTGVSPWSAQAVLYQAPFCEVLNGYFYGGSKFPDTQWRALMGVWLNASEGAIIENNFFFGDTWSVWTTTSVKPTAGYVPPLLKNNTFFLSFIWCCQITGYPDNLKLRNNLFAECVRGKWGHPYLRMWSAGTKLDSDYNFFWWYNDKQGKPNECRVAMWHGRMTDAEIGATGLGGGLAAWQKFSTQDMHSLEGFFPSNNLYDQLDFTVAGKPYAGKGENGADIGCTWIGKYTDQVIIPDAAPGVDVPPWKK